MLSLHSAVGAGFVLVDDHEILSFTPQALADPEVQHQPTLLDEIFVSDASGGRVRPMYWVIRYGESELLDAHPQLWHGLYVGLGLLSAVLFFTTARTLGADRLPAVMGGAWLIVAPGVSSVWVRLGPQESLGTVLVMAGCLCWSLSLKLPAWPGWTWLFVVFAFAAAFVKESFALLPPALVGWALLVWKAASPKRSFRRHDLMFAVLVPLAGSGIAILLAFLTAIRAAPGSYGGNVLAGEGVERVTPLNLVILAADGGLIIPILVIGLVLVGIRRRRLSSPLVTWCAGALVLSLLVVPQLVLYRGQPGFIVGRYVLPTGIGLAATFVAGATWLRRQRLHIMLLAVEALWAVVLVFGALWTWRESESMLEDSIALNRMVDAIVTSAPTGATVAIAADPRHLEESVSLPYHLAARRRPDLHVRLIAVPTGDPTESPSTEALKSYFEGRSGLGERGCDGVDAVVLFSDLDLAAQSEPCLGTDGFKLELFTQIAALPSFVPEFLRALLPPLASTYALLERR